MKERRKAIWKRVLAWLFYVLGGILALLLILVLLLKTEWGQNRVRAYAVSWLGKKLNTRVAIGGLKTDWLNALELHDLYLEDHEGKPLASIGKLQVGYNLINILRGNISVNTIILDHATVRLYRPRTDSNFNFDFINKAFTTDTTSNRVDTSSKTSIHLGLISLEHVRFEMDDQYGGQSYVASGRYLKLLADQVDFNKMDFELKYFLTDSVTAAVKMFEPFKKEEPQTRSSEKALSISIDTLGIANTSFTFDDSSSSMQIITRADRLSGKKVFYNLAKMFGSATSLEMVNHGTIVKMHSVTKEGKVIPATGTSSKPFTFDVKKLVITNNGFALDDDAKPLAPKHTMDFSHLDLQAVNIQADNISYNGTEYRAAIELITGREKSGFVLKRASAIALYSNSAFSLQKLQLQTGQNELQGNLAMNYKSLGEISSKPSQTKVNLAISNGRLHLDELLYFQPSLANNRSFQPLLGKEFLLSTTATGTLDNLHIPDLSIRQDHSVIKAGADVYNLPDTKKLIVNLYLKQFEGGRKELLALLPRNTIPDSLLHYIPPYFSVTGVYKGGLQNMFVDLQLKSDYGGAHVKGNLKNITDKKSATYNVALDTRQFRLDKLMNDTMYGSVTGNFIVNGRGLDIHTAVANANASIDEMNYQGYTYKGIRLKGKLGSNTIHADLQSDDPNANLTSVTTYNMSSNHGSFQTKTQVNNLDLFKLGFMKDSLALSGDIDGNIPQLDTAHLIGDLYVTKLELKSGSRTYPLDSIVFNAKYERDTQFMNLRTPFLTAELTGQFTLQSLLPAAQTIANRYIYTKSTDTVFHRPVVATFRAHVNVPDTILQFVPNLKKLTPFDVVSEINTNTSVLKLYADIQRIVYQNYVIDSFSCNLASFGAPQMADQMLYSFGMERMFGPGFMLNNSVVAGSASHGVFNGSIKLMGAKRDDLRYLLPYRITNDPDEPFVELPDSLTIDGNIWNASQDNKVYLDLAKLKGSKLKISRGDQSISILADNESASGLPLHLALSKFDLDNISNILISDTSMVAGIVNGELTVQSFTPLGFTSDLKIEGLKLRNSDAGDLVAKITSGEGKNLNVDINLKGSVNNASLTGTYNVSDQASDLKLHLDPLDVQTAAPFVTQYLGKLNGRLRGDLDVTGNFSSPRLHGKLVTDSIETISRYYGTMVRVPAGELIFDDEGAKFENFAFLDSLGRRGNLTGRVLTKDYRIFKYDLSLKLDSFQVVGRRKYADQTMYGPTIVNALLTLKTDEANVLQIDGKVGVVDKSSFTYVYISEVNSQKGEGLIEFFNPAVPVDSFLLKRNEQSAAAAMQIAMNIVINLTPESEVTIMMDEVSGDHLLIKGSANLNYARSADGRQNLTGIYTVESGEYDLSIAQLIRKKFIIQKGSTLAWSGDPLKADMNITALYKVKTSAGELVNDIQSVPGIDKQKLDFEVYLLLTGQLLKPDINFRLDMDENDQAVFNGLVYSRIKQVNSMPAELNKQVMGLLALNHFIADNPFSSLAGGGTSMQTQAFATAGSLITQQLTDLVGQFVKDVNIDFALDVNDNFTTGQAVRTTNLKVGVTKSLANNRLSVYVGSSFALEGQNQDANALSGLAGDVTVEYQLTSDGKYRLKAYRINQNELTFQGTIVKTGVTFLVVLEFNKLKNAFRKNRAKPAI